jgi:hypothetical protein
MHTDSIADTDGQLTQVGPDPLDYVLRYTACDYDCYHQRRYIGSRATLPRAIEAVEYEQAKAARHAQLSPAANATIAIYQEELRAIAARLHDLANRLASHPAEQAPTSAQLTIAHITQAIKNVQDAKRSCALVERASDPAIPLDAAA